jgi:uncharacterized protein (DUF3084 family)
MKLFNLKGKTTMKTSILISAIVACALAAPIVSAQERPTPAGPAMNMDMDKQLPRMQENMKKMQRQMDRIHKTTDMSERQKLMQEHMQAMQENMKAMRGMGGPMMKGAGEHGGMKGGTREGDMNKRQDMMEQRTDMMQMMMEQMIQRDQAMESMPHK